MIKKSIVSTAFDLETGERVPVTPQVRYDMTRRDAWIATNRRQWRMDKVYKIPTGRQSWTKGRLVASDPWDLVFYEVKTNG